jgi:hypothetical protein
MRIPIDECVDPRLKSEFPDHTTKTVFDMGWSGVKNGELLMRAQGQFDVFETIDKGIEFQQDLARFGLGIVVISVSKNRIEYYRPILADIRQALKSVRPGGLIHVAQKGAT